MGIWRNMYVCLYTYMWDTTINENKERKGWTGTFEVERGKEQGCICVIILKFKKKI